MQMFNGLIEVQQMVVYPSPSEVLSEVVKIIDDAQVDIGELSNQLEEIKEIVEGEIADQEEPILLDEEQQNFIFGLAMILGVTVNSN